MINKELPACRSCARWPGSKIACQRFGRTIESLLPKCLESRLLSCCSTLTGVAMKCDCEGLQSGCAPSFASTDALPERGGNPFLIGTCKPQGSRGRTLPSAPRSWPLDASHSCPGACVFRPRRSPGRSEVPARELQRHACGDTRARCSSSEARQSGCRSLGLHGRDPAGPSWLAQGEDERRARRPPPRTGAHRRAGGQPSIRHRPGARGGLVRGGP